MLNGIWGRKIGMTQVFSDQNKAVPVTVINVDNWFVIGIKTKEKDGYSAIKVGLVRKRHVGKEFSAEWLKKPAKFFTFVREIKTENAETEYQVGMPVDVATILQEGKVHAFGVSKGRGFAGVMKRHGFSGAPASHGQTLGRAPGSIGFMATQGKVMKGKKLPGHMGVDRCAVRNLDIIKVDSDAKIVLVKGSVPGNAGSLIYLQKV